jgi:hypothetical protein
MGACRTLRSSRSLSTRAALQPGSTCDTFNPGGTDGARGTEDPLRPLRASEVSRTRQARWSSAADRALRAGSTLRPGAEAAVSFPAGRDHRYPVTLVSLDRMIAEPAATLRAEHAAGGLVAPLVTLGAKRCRLRNWQPRERMDYNRVRLGHREGGNGQ